MKNLVKSQFLKKLSINRFVIFNFNEKLTNKKKQEIDINLKAKIVNNKDNTKSTITIEDNTSSNSNNSEKKKKFKVLTKEEIDQIYQDKLFYFKYQWNKIQKEKKQFFQDYLSPDFNNHQQHECDVLFNIIKNFNDFEKNIFDIELEKYSNKAVNPNASKFKYIKAKELDPNFNNIQEILLALQPFIASRYFLGGAQEQIDSQAQAKVEVKVEKIEEKPKEKAIVNLKLTGFDAAKKIVLIKEFRTLFNLGLKEAKDAVEAVPSILKKEIKREEALELKTKLEAVGAKLEIE
jgi:large subunit ribosomal protein L7/L12